jgi:hypothetical protein
MRPGHLLRLRLRNQARDQVLRLLAAALIMVGFLLAIVLIAMSLAP